MTSLFARATVLIVTAALLGCADDAPIPAEPSALPVRTEVVATAPFQATLDLLGSVRPSETVSVITVSGGTISYPRRFASGLRGGETVRAGEILAYVENETARRYLAEAKLQSEAAHHELEQSTSAFASGLVSRADLTRDQIAARLAAERLSSAEREARRRALLAPRSGRLIVTRAVPPSSELPANTIIAEIAAGGRPRVVAAAAASMRDKLRAGLQARFSAAGGTSPTGHGTITEVAPVVDESGVIRLVIDVSDDDGLPAPGEGVEVEIALDRKPDTITIPEEALVISSSGNAVFTVGRSDMYSRALRATRVPVETGGRGDGRVEIIRGLAPGDRVVVSGAAFLTEGAFVVEASAEEKKGQRSGMIPLTTNRGDA